MELETSKELKLHEAVPCLSILLPTHPTAPGRRVDMPQLKKAIQKAKQLLGVSYGNLGKELYQQLDEVYEKENTVYHDEGIGIFIAPGYSKTISFPFPVEEKISVGEEFQFREILLKEQESIRYFHLELDKKEIRLYKGKGEILKEVKNHEFPIKQGKDWNYQPPARGSSYSNSLKNFEGDKSIVEEKRFIELLLRADELLHYYVHSDTPCFVSGTNQETGYFKKITQLKKNFAGIVDGKYIPQKNNQAQPKILEEVKAWQNEKEDEELEKLNDTFGKRRVAGGLEEVWHALNSGMGQMLYVEKDFKCAGFVTDATRKLSRKVPKERHRLFADVVDFVMNNALSQKIPIRIVGNNKLYEHDKIALLLRYKKEVK